MAFRGTFDHSLDAKNRLTVPAKFRTALAGGVVLAKALEPCMSVWTPPEFDAYVATALAPFNPLSPQAQKLSRFFSANSFDTELDAAGRIMVPAFLLEHAGLKKDCVVAGAGESLEVWDRDRWADYNRALTTDVGEITALLGQA